MYIYTFVTSKTTKELGWSLKGGPTVLPKNLIHVVIATILKFMGVILLRQKKYLCFCGLEDKPKIFIYSETSITHLNLRYPVPDPSPSVVQFYWNKSAINPLYILLLLPHL